MRILLLYVRNGNERDYSNTLLIVHEDSDCWRLKVRSRYYQFIVVCMLPDYRVIVTLDLVLQIYLLRAIFLLSSKMSTCMELAC